MKLKTIIQSTLFVGLITTNAFAQNWGQDNWSAQFDDSQLNNPVNNPLANFNYNQFNQWCDRYVLNMKQQAKIADRLLVRRRFGQAVKVVRQTLNNSGVLANQPPQAYKPYIYQALARTAYLLNQFGLQKYTDSQLDSIDTNPGTSAGVAQNLALLATVGVGQLKMIASIDDGFNEMLDQQIYQHRKGKCGDCEQQIQVRLQDLAVKELRAFQNYATLSQAGKSFPIIDTPTYFKLLGNIANWVATDLQFNAFPSLFSCPINDLMNLPGLANQLLYLDGHRVAFRKINWYVDRIIQNLDGNSYGCGQYNIPYNTYQDEYDYLYPYYDVDGSGDGR